MARVKCAPAGKSGAAAVARAVELGLVVHVEHPSFPGVTMTAGVSRRADGSRVYEMIAHGATSDVCGDLHDEGFDSAIHLGRNLEIQVGNRRCYWAAQAKLEGAVSP